MGPVGCDQCLARAFQARFASAKIEQHIVQRRPGRELGLPVRGRDIACFSTLRRQIGIKRGQFCGARYADLRRCDAGIGPGLAGTGIAAQGGIDGVDQRQVLRRGGLLGARAGDGGVRQ